MWNIPNEGVTVMSEEIMDDGIWISKKTLDMIDSSMRNFKQGKISKPVDLSSFSDDIDDLYVAEKVLEDIRSGREKLISLDEVVKQHGLDD